MRLPGVSLAALIVRLPRSQAFYNLKTPALFAPYVVDLHGSFTFCRNVQVLLGQMCPQLPDLKLETVGVYAYSRREKKNVEMGFKQMSEEGKKKDGYKRKERQEKNETEKRKKGERENKEGVSPS